MLLRQAFHLDNYFRILPSCFPVQADFGILQSVTLESVVSGNLLSSFVIFDSLLDNTFGIVRFRALCVSFDFALT
jgi:hypothetical protein